MNNGSRWYFRFPGNFYATGPTTGYYTSERAVREMLRDSYGFIRLPRGTEIWKA